MFHRQVLLNFVQQDLEPLHSAWWRYKDLLINFPHHGFSKESQLEIFINSLRNTTRMWVEIGEGIISFYQKSMDEAYYLLEDMAEYDHWKWICSRRNQVWGNNFNRNNFNSVEQQVDTRLYDQLMTLNEIFIRGVEMMRPVQEKSSTNVQHMVEESTYRVRKEMIFDDEYEPLKEVHVSFVRLLV